MNLPRFTKSSSILTSHPACFGIYLPTPLLFSCFLLFSPPSPLGPCFSKIFLCSTHTSLAFHSCRRLILGLDCSFLNHLLYFWILLLVFILCNTRFFAVLEKFWAFHQEFWFILRYFSSLSFHIDWPNRRLTSFPESDREYDFSFGFDF